MADPQSFNRNSYVQNDPVNFVDPTGLVTYDGAADPHLIAQGLVGGLLWAIQHGGVLAFNHGIRIGDDLYAHWSFSFFTPQEKPQLERNLARDPVNMDKWNQCLREAAGDQLGVTELITALALTPIPKKGRVLRMPGSSDYTNPISYIGHKLFRGANLSFKVLGTNRIFGIAGRLVPAVAVGLAVYDVARIIDKQAECYEKATREN